MKNKVKYTAYSSGRNQQHATDVSKKSDTQADTKRYKRIKTAYL